MIRIGWLQHGHNFKRNVTCLISHVKAAGSDERSVYVWLTGNVYEESGGAFRMRLSERGDLSFSETPDPTSSCSNAFGTAGRICSWDKCVHSIFASSRFLIVMACIHHRDGIGTRTTVTGTFRDVFTLHKLLFAVLA